MDTKDEARSHLIKWLEAERALALQGFAVPREQLRFPPPRPRPNCS